MTSPAPHDDPPAEVEWIPCCEHCGCRGGDRKGHDDTCRYGCNDAPAAVAASHERTGAVAEPAEIVAIRERHRTCTPDQHVFGAGATVCDAPTLLAGLDRLRADYAAVVAENKALREKYEVAE